MKARHHSGFASFRRMMISKRSLSFSVRFVEFMPTVLQFLFQVSVLVQFGGTQEVYSTKNYPKFPVLVEIGGYWLFGQNVKKPLQRASWSDKGLH